MVLYMRFDPVFRMVVMSDIHYKADIPTEPERFKKGMELAYKYARKNSYSAIDALFVVGDFANRGQEDEMLLFKNSLSESVAPETETVLMLASHEFMSAGVEAAYEKLGRIFSKAPDEHKVINGFHCISMSCDKGCEIQEKKQEWLKRELAIAADDDWKKPIFVFQHPHLSGTVYGSINWGENDIISILMNYPQVVDFSGHSHAPINDPRSVHQKYFSSFGTGSLSYFELDEFDKLGGTVPLNAHECAQFLIVEVDAQNRVLVKPFDILSGEFFENEWLIEKPHDPGSFTYTDARYRNPEKPFFDTDTFVKVEKEENGYFIAFGQAKGIKERIDSYTVVIKDKSCGRIVKQLNETSSYYIYKMPEVIRIPLGALTKGEYVAQISANGFWNNASEKFIYSFEVFE